LGAPQQRLVVGAHLALVLAARGAEQAALLVPFRTRHPPRCHQQTVSFLYRYVQKLRPILSKRFEDA
jgi:hypothetical protein